MLAGEKTTHSLDGQHQDADRAHHGSQSEWQRTEINGESMFMVWPTLASRTAEEQKRTDIPTFTFTIRFRTRLWQCHIGWSSSKLYCRLVYHERCSMARLQPTFLGPHLRCSLASTGFAHPREWCSRLPCWFTKPYMDLHQPAWFVLLTYQDVVASALNVPIICWFHPSDCLLLAAGPFLLLDRPSGIICWTTWLPHLLCLPSASNWKPICSSSPSVTLYWTEWFLKLFVLLDHSKIFDWLTDW